MQCFRNCTLSRFYYYRVVIFLGRKAKILGLALLANSKTTFINKQNMPRDEYNDVISDGGGTISKQIETSVISNDVMLTDRLTHRPTSLCQPAIPVHL